jgi:RNA polymerase sigma-70 factor (ECF subfamily)
VNDREWLAGEFETWRPHLRSVAYGMLGSMTEAEDAVQECWIRLDRNDPAMVSNLRSWLTTVVGRICLDMLRARRVRRESYVGSWLPEPIVERGSYEDPEHEAVLADSVGLALLVVLDTLNPAERLAFVLHDVFGVPFDEIADIVERSPQAARQLAARARRRVRTAPTPDADLARQRVVVDAFLTAARTGDMNGLLAVLDPDVIFRADVGIGSPLARYPITGAEAVAESVLASAPRFISLARPAIVNGQAGAVFADRKPVGVLGFTIVHDRIVAIDLVADPKKLQRIPGNRDTPR